MTQPILTRESVRARLHIAQAALRACIGSQSEAELQALRVTPEWSALDLLRHMWVWNELGARCLESWGDERAWTPKYDDEDVFNLDMVAARAEASLATIVAGLDAAHQRFADALDHSSDADLGEVGAAPWDEQVTQLHLLNELLGHDLEHLAQIS